MPFMVSPLGKGPEENPVFTTGHRKKWKTTSQTVCQGHAMALTKLSVSWKGREIPKRHGANTINRVYMADCLWISRHELRRFGSRTDPAIIHFSVCTLNPGSKEQGAASGFTHHTELAGMGELGHGSSTQQPLSKKIDCSI